jgi:quercetin dioxygenase-like cupin family protein
MEIPMRASLLSVGLLLCAATVHAQTAAAHKMHHLSWGPAPAVFPKGAKMAVVSGDPMKAAQFTVELSLPAGYRIPPHFHPTDEDVQVKKGTLLVGMGDTLDLKQTKALKAGSTGKVPAQQHHYAAARGATVISVSAMGPFAMTYVNPADDPQSAASK